MTNKILKIINQFPYFQFVVKHLAKRLSISSLINTSLKASLVSNLVIAVSTNSYQLLMKFLKSFVNRLEVRGVFLDI